MMRLWLFIVALLSFSVFSFRTTERAYHLSGYAQGTTYHITYYAADSVVGQQDIDRILDGIDSSLSVYKSYSVITKFNQSARGCRADRHLKLIVEKAGEVWKNTDGIFDITVQPMVQLWGFGVKSSNEVPDSGQVRERMKCVGMDKIFLKSDSLIKASPCISIDVNGIAQGYSVDVVAHYLESRGLGNYLVEIGGEIRLKGRRQPDGKLMSVGIEAPGDDTNPEPLQKIIHLPGGAITTSGNYRKFYMQGSRRISHLIDARTGFPIDNELISVTVWAKDAITADGYDNALMGMGLQKALQFAEKKKDFEIYLVYRRPDGVIADTCSQGFTHFFTSERR